MAIQFEIPKLKLESLANKREHWRMRATRANHQRFRAKIFTMNAICRVGPINALLAATGRETVGPPKEILITRIGKRKLDSDNLAISAKHVRDGIADALGIDDGDESKVKWHYAQEIGKDYGVRVQIQ